MSAVEPGGPLTGGGVIIDIPPSPSSGGAEPVVVSPFTGVTSLGLPYLIPALVRLPDDLYQIERVTWNDKRCDPLRSREVEVGDSRYELNMGQVDGYIQDKDGLRALRKWRKPSAPYIGHAYEEMSSLWGILRSLGDVSSAGVDGPWGELTSVPGEEVAGGPWGIIRTIYRPQNNVKIEYRRRPQDLEADTDSFEIPERYVKYVRWFVLSRALGRDGDGQDLELSGHYRERFDAGVERIQKRRIAVQSQQKFVMGGAKATEQRRLPLARFPSNYGQVVR